MWHNYLKIAFRNLRRQKTFALINIAGLAVGMAAAILIAMWVKFELSYDDFHQNLERIHRVVTDSNGFRTPTTPGPMAAALQQQIPEVESATRFKGDVTVLEYNGKGLRAEGLNAEPAFFEIFDFPVLAGDPRTALDDVGSIVLTNTTAQRLFGEEDPIGKVIKLANKWTAKVAAVVADVPANSSPPLLFEYLAPFKTYYFWRDPDNWTASSDYQTWVKLHENCTAATANAKIDNLFAPYNEDGSWRPFLQPLREIHLQPDTHRWDGPHGNLTTVIIFSLLAVVIIIMAGINFINLTTARALSRAREIGVRKIIGASRRHLILQLLMEAFLSSFLALLLATILTELTLPFFNNLAAVPLSIHYNDTWFIALSSLILIFSGLFSGFIPALYLSSFQPVDILKNTPITGTNPRHRSLNLRTVLVIFQFALATITLIVVLVIRHQLDYIHNENLGFDKDNLIYLSVENNYRSDSFEAVKTELLALPGVQAVAASDQIPTDTDYILNGEWIINDQPQSTSFPVFAIGKDFLETYNINLLLGRSMAELGESEWNSSALINETAASRLGFDDPIGQTVKLSGIERTIIGLVSDFNFESFREVIEPCFLVHSDWGGLLNIRIGGHNQLGTLKEINEVIQRHFPGMPFDFKFLSDEINNLYLTDQRVGHLFMYFGLLAFFISCLGLYGMIIFTAERRTKEIGIRKILGATVPNLVLMMTGYFFKLIIIANLIAWPISWWVMRNWLENFAYHTDIKISIFLLAGIITVLIAGFTVSLQAIRAAAANPVDSLRHE